MAEITGSSIGVVSGRRVQCMDNLPVALVHICSVVTKSTALCVAFVKTRFLSFIFIELPCDDGLPHLSLDKRETLQGNSFMDILYEGMRRWNSSREEQQSCSHP